MLKLRQYVEALRAQYLDAERGVFEKIPNSRTSSEIDTESNLHTHGEGTSRKLLRQPRPFIFNIIDLALAILAATSIYLTATQKAIDFEGDVTGFVPSFSSRLVEFDWHPEFISNHTSEASLVQAREAWKTLVPPGQGFLSITEDDAKHYNFPPLISYELPPGEAPPGKPDHGHSLGTSVVHSLHCLYTIMAEYDLATQQKPPMSLEHMNHCIDYIRQSIMCGADLTLASEGSQLGVPHVCKNWDEIYQYLDEKRVTSHWQFGDPAHHFVPPDR